MQAHLGYVKLRKFSGCWAQLLKMCCAVGLCLNLLVNGIAVLLGIKRKKYKVSQKDVMVIIGKLISRLIITTAYGPGTGGGIKKY